jgi:uncharacterized repeat protein (TIGR01451 family)
MQMRDAHRRHPLPSASIPPVSLSPEVASMTNFWRTWRTAAVAGLTLGAFACTEAPTDIVDLEGPGFGPMLAEIDLSNPAGGQDTINDGIWTFPVPFNVGTGQINPFLTIQDDPEEEGFNTDASPLPLDAKRPQFTDALPLNFVPTIEGPGGIGLFREIILDMNESNSAPDALLSIDRFDLWLCDDAGAPAYDMRSDFDSNGDCALVYDLDDDIGGSDVDWIKATDEVTSGSGLDLDYQILIPEQNFLDAATAVGADLSGCAYQGLEADPCGIYLVLDAKLGFQGGDLGTNATFEEFSTIKRPYLDITKTAAEDTVAAGDTISFTIVVENPSDDVAENVTLTDTLPNGGLNWFEDPDHPDCSIAGGILTCNFGDLDGGDSETVTVSAETDPADCGLVFNRAWTDADAIGAINDTADVVVECPDIDIEKTAAEDTVTAGDTITFTIDVWNNGPGTAVNVTLTDTLPNGGLSWFEDPDNTDCSIAAGILSCSFGDLAEDDTASVTISAETDAADCGTVLNRAWADADNSDNPVNDTADVVVQCPDIDIEKTAAADTVSAGDTITFTIDVWNNGPGTATNVTLTDTLPNGGLSWFEDPDNTDCSIAAGILTCSFGDLMPDDTASVTVSAETDAADCGTVTNRAWADADNDDPVNDTADVVVECPDIDIEKTAAADTVTAGDTITFTIDVWNNGPGTAKNVTLTDTLPNGGLTWFEDPDNADCMIAGGILTCDFGDLMPDDTASVTISAETDVADCGTVFNRAWADADNDDAVNDTADIEVICPPEDDETAWASNELGVPLVLPFNPGGTGNWATYVEYLGAEKLVTFYADQTTDVGTVHFSAPVGGMVTITIMLTGGATFADGSVVAVQDYSSAPSGNPSPGQFDYKESPDSPTMHTITVPENNYYAVHSVVLVP